MSVGVCASGAAGAIAEEVQTILQRACGFTLTASLRPMLAAAFREAARHLGLDNDRFLERLRRADPVSVAALVDASVVGETYFYRHREQFAALDRLLLRGALAAERLVFWSAGCSSGEEPFTIAMALVLAGRADAGDRIVATDVCDRALTRARAGVYGRWALRHLEPALRERFFSGDAGSARLLEEVRGRVEFRRHNLVTEPAPVERCDAIFCRNVLIYFPAPTAAGVLRRLADALKPGGYLIVAPADEPFAEGLPFDVVEADGARLLRKQDPAAPRAPLAPSRPRATRREAGAAAVSAPTPSCRAPHGERGAATQAAAAPPAAADERADPAVVPLPALFDRAREAARGGDEDGAERLAAESAERELDPRSFLLLAMLAEGRGDLVAAAAALRAALYLEPGLAAAHAAQVPLFLRMNRRDEAVRARRNALRALEGLDDEAQVRGVEAMTVGALRVALAACDAR